MTLIFFVLLAILVIGPLRRPYLRFSRFTVPATAGAIAGFVFGSIVMALARVPGPFALLIPVVMAIGMGLGCGESFNNWCDKTFDDKPHDHGPRT
jgi:heme O synthase-like polyprenyltransferase